MPSLAGKPMASRDEDEPWPRRFREDWIDENRQSTNCARKVLIPLVLMAIGVLAVAGFGAARLNGVSSTASDIIERRDLAAVELNGAARIMATIPHSIFAILLYDETDAGRAAWTHGIRQPRAGKPQAPGPSGDSIARLRRRARYIQGAFLRARQ